MCMMYIHVDDLYRQGETVLGSSALLDEKTPLGTPNVSLTTPPLAISQCPLGHKQF